MKYVNILSIFLTLLSVNAYCQNSETSKSTSYTIAYGSNGVCLTNVEGTSVMRLTTGNDGYPAWSPDGKRIAMYSYHDEKKTWSIHTIDSDGTNRKRLTHAKNKWDSMPTWSPDGTKIVFAREYKDSKENWQYEIWIMNSDGSEQTQIKPLKGGGPSFTPDGRLLFHSEFKDKESEISIADIDGQNIIHLTDNEAEEWDPKISPDGKQIAFMSKRDGNREIYVMNIDGSNQKRLTNNNRSNGGPSWSPDGYQLIFQSERNEITHIHIMNKDGSSERKITSTGWQPAWFNTTK
jgi:TolB protein